MAEEVALKEMLYTERLAVAFDVLAVEPRQDQELLALPILLYPRSLVVVQKKQHWQWGL